jgi:hypothetical protein
LIQRIGSDQPIQVAGLKFVRVARKGLEVADTIVAGAPAEGLLALGSQCAKRRVTAGAAAADHEPPGVGVSLLDQDAGAGDAVLDVDNAPSTLEPKPVRTAIAGAAAIIHVKHPTPRLVQYCVESESALDAADVGPP